MAPRVKRPNQENGLVRWSSGGAEILGASTEIRESPPGLLAQ
jgi:hypothetical protein